MKNFYYLAVALMAAVFFVSCSDSDDNGSQGGNGDKARTDCGLHGDVLQLWWCKSGW